MMATRRFRKSYICLQRCLEIAPRSLLFAVVFGFLLYAPQSQAQSSSSSLPLEDLHDVGYILQLIKQQSVDIYAEATRRKTLSDSTIGPLDRIPDQPLLAESEYKPLRKAWIVFFLGTMEPLAKLLDEGSRDVTSGAVELKVPADKKPALDHLMAEMSERITAINQHLNKCADLLDTTESGNLIIARESAGIASDAAKAEEIRVQAVKMFGNLGEPGTYQINDKK